MLILNNFIIWKMSSTNKKVYLSYFLLHRDKSTIKLELNPPVTVL